MTKENIVILELVSGARVIGELNAPAGPIHYSFNEPRLIRLAMDSMGRTAVMMLDIDAPYAATPTKEASIPVSCVIRDPLRYDNINEDLLNSYISTVSGIAMPSKGDVII